VNVTPGTQTASTPRPSPVPTRFVPPAGPYIHLSRQAGPPRQRTLTVTGGHLPTSAEVSLQWMAGNRSPLTTIAWTNSAGRLATQFTVPASPPGSYRIVAVINGTTYASAPYHIESLAALAVTVAPSGNGDLIRVRGDGFVSGARLMLITYPLGARLRPFLLAQVTSGTTGDFAVARLVRRLPLGQYVLRAYTEGGLTAQMAEAYFEVVI